MILIVLTYFLQYKLLDFKNVTFEPAFQFSKVVGQVPPSFFPVDAPACQCPTSEKILQSSVLWQPSEPKDQVQDLHMYFYEWKDDHMKYLKNNCTTCEKNVYFSLY